MVPELTRKRVFDDRETRYGINAYSLRTCNPKRIVRSAHQEGAVHKASLPHGEGLCDNCSFVREGERRHRDIARASRCRPGVPRRAPSGSKARVAQLGHHPRRERLTNPTAVGH